MFLESAVSERESASIARRRQSTLIYIAYIYKHRVTNTLLIIKIYNNLNNNIDTTES